MERLTEWIGEGDAIPRMDLKRTGYSKCMVKLAKYEDLGLEPDEIRLLKGRKGKMSNEQCNECKYQKWKKDNYCE